MQKSAGPAIGLRRHSITSWPLALRLRPPRLTHYEGPRSPWPRRARGWVESSWPGQLVRPQRLTALPAAGRRGPLPGLARPPSSRWVAATPVTARALGQQTAGTSPSSRGPRRGACDTPNRPTAPAGHPRRSSSLGGVWPEGRAAWIIPCWRAHRPGEPAGSIGAAGKRAERKWQGRAACVPTPAAVQHHWTGRSGAQYCTDF
jgi:hypothetical protein